MKYRKTVCGYHCDYGTHDMHWDNFGYYLGQYQHNVLANEPSQLYIKSMPFDKVASLTRFQMLYADIHAFLTAKSR